MILTNLVLTHFRNYDKRELRFSPNITYIVGPNTSGKTNLLEAIYTIATGKSFRADQDREMIQWGSEIGRIQAGIDSTTCDLTLTSGQVGGDRAPLKKYKVNGVPRQMIDFVGNLKAVLFWPEHLGLVTDSPGVRRRYLDSVLVQVDREYRRNLQSYERGLRQRNKLLDLVNDGTASRSQLLFWNQLLIKTGSYLTDKRAEFIEYINHSHDSIHVYQLEYDKSVISEARLHDYADAEIAAKATLVGPHRDDFLFLIGAGRHTHAAETEKMIGKQHLRDLSKFGSRGEQRLAVLWLKLAEVTYIHKQAGERPVLLLDDILSELDNDHRELVFDVIQKQQTVITSADEEIPDGIRSAKDSDIIRLSSV